MLEKFRAPVPGIQLKFSEENFVDFHVVQEAKLIRLNTYREKAKGQSPRALLLLFHGLNSHLNHGGMVAQKFSEEGIEVVGFDHRGFGKSEGQSGYLESVEIHLQDSRKWFTMIDKLYPPELPRFIGGLSMGGMTSYRLSLEFPEKFKGAILFAPAISQPMSKFLHGMAKFFAFFIPKTQLIQPEKGVVCQNPAVGEEFRNNDPYMYQENIKPNTAQIIMNAMEAANETFESYKCPFIVIQGGCDKLVDPDVADELIERSQTTDKQKIYYEDMWHDIWHEDEIYEILPQVIQWTLDRVPEQQNQQKSEEQKGDSEIPVQNNSTNNNNNNNNKETLNENKKSVEQLESENSEGNIEKNLVQQKTSLYSQINLDEVPPN